MPPPCGKNELSPHFFVATLLTNVVLYDRSWSPTCTPEYKLIQKNENKDQLHVRTSSQQLYFREPEGPASTTFQVLVLFLLGRLEAEGASGAKGEPPEPEAKGALEGEGASAAGARTCAHTSLPSDL